MNVVTRGIRNAFRNNVRLFSIVVIVGLSIGLALTMLTARQAVQAKIDSVKSSIGNTITISPAGARGAEGGGEPLTADQLAKVKVLPHVVGLAESLQDRLTPSDTNMQSAIEAGSIGRRQARAFRGGDSEMPRTMANFTPPLQLIGANDLANTQALGATLHITAGTTFDANADQNTAIVGQALATKNNLAVGSTFQAYGATVTVAGIFDAGNRFANGAFAMPLLAVQRLSGQANSITMATAKIDSITNIDAATSSIKSTLGDAADVVSQQDTSSQALEPLENIKRITLLSLVGAVAAGVVIILLTMVMIVRERRREIGVLKAIGASTWAVIVQFVAEAVTFTFIGALAGLIFGVVASNPIIKLLVNNASSAQSTTARGGGFFRAVGNSVDVHNIQTTIGWEVLLYGLVAACIIAVVGSAFPAWLIAKVRPAEVMRAE